ncbi:putative membrane protein [Friedmanniella luteola]|uniref:Putative membrane protein n=1 Tax=Friedmanniella luteola TaxID=546871 RepID=A0A1H2A313_9ACTN|nr:YhgE/Pip domain-containing protein [Friedmanniella luteola]SDT40355.1 putative membrane protein [Friedmanniella luteola]
MYPLERATSSRRVGLWSLVGLVLVPLVVAAGFLWATWDSTDRLDRVQAAVVNLDEPVELDGQTVPLGRQLAGGLVTGGSGEEKVDTNFDWVLTDQADATAGLASGDYAAVVTIPKTFSARATSFSKTDPDKIRPATIDVRTSESSGIADPVVGQAITAAATSALNTTLTQQYLDGIYVGFNDLGKQFKTVADASDKLADGTDELATGIDGVSTGTSGLAEGLQQLDDGAQQLATGSAGLTTGTAGLAAGLQKLSDGASALPAGARTLATGTAASADGAGELADGAKQLSGGASQLSTGATQLATGTKGISQGLSTYQQELRRQAAQTAASVKAPSPPSGGQPQLPCPTTEPALTEAQCAVVQATLDATVEQVAEQATAQVRTAAAYAGAQGAAQALRGAADGISTKDPKTGQSLLSGATQVANGAGGVATGAKSLSTGTSGLAGGASELADGLDQLADGTDQFAQGLVPLTQGIASSADGADQLATGVREFGTGVTGLASGTAQSATGADELAKGTVKLADAGEQLADGSRELSDGLAKGADAVPTYDAQTREKLSDVASRPVQTEAPTSAFSDVTTTTFLAVLALWVGALASFLVLRPFTARVLASMKPSWRLALEGLLPALVVGLVQAVALGVVLELLLDLPVGRTLQMGAFLGLTAAAFVALNHALVAWFGGVGRFVSVVVLVAGAAGAVTAAVPASFDVLRPFLPLTPALDGLRALVTDGSGAGAGGSLLLAWLLVGLVAGVLAVARRRVVAPLVVAPAV